MMKAKTLFNTALAALLLTACSGSDDLTTAVVEPVTPPAPTTRGIPFTATVLGQDATRALSDGTTTVSAAWTAGEQLELIYTVGGSTVSSTATVQSVDGSGTATITATLDENVTDETAVTLIYPSSAVDSYTHDVRENLLKRQDGSLATLGARLDVRRGQGSITVAEGEASLAEGATLTPQYAVCKFKLWNTNTSTALPTQRLVISRAADDDVICIVTPSSAESELWVALEPSTVKMKFSTTVSDVNYATTGTAKLSAGRFYTPTVQMEEDDPYAQPLTLQAFAAGTLAFTSRGHLQYSMNGGERQTMSSLRIDVSEGDVLRFYYTVTSADDAPNTYFKINTTTTNASFYVYGNVMSLIDAENFKTAKTITAPNAFSNLFSSLSAKIQNHPTKDLVLPATTLSSGCYQAMFNATRLTRAPELPAPVMTENCYRMMFYNCGALTSAPELPVTTMAPNCYRQMFTNCRALTTAPTLPAMTLAESCYYAMFSGCTALTEAPALPATTLAESCYYQMFYGCTGLTEAPLLPAETLVENCYYAMFYGCTSLHYIKCLATTTATNATKGWVGEVSGTGTFIAADGTVNAMNRWMNTSRGNNTVPSYWTLKTVSEE